MDAQTADAGEKGLLLADNGEARMPIVISATAMNATEPYKREYFTPTTGERKVAYELAATTESVLCGKSDVSSTICGR